MNNLILPHNRRYLLFTCSEYYPCGGMGDHKGSFCTVAEALLKLEELRKQNKHCAAFFEIYDIVEETLVSEG